MVPTPNNSNRVYTRFHELLVTAYREFYNVTFETIIELRKSLQLKVVQGLDMYAKRSVVRNLSFNSKFSKEQLFFLCDRFYSVCYYNQKSGRKENEEDDDGKTADRMDIKDFKIFMGKVYIYDKYV